MLRSARNDEVEELCRWREVFVLRRRIRALVGAALLQAALQARFDSALAALFRIVVSPELIAVANILFSTPLDCHRMFPICSQNKGFPMGNDHEYALGGVNRSTIGKWVGTLAATISALLVFVILSLVDVARAIGLDANIPPSIFSLVGAAAVYRIIYLVFSRYIWKWRVVSSALSVPDLTGKWTCSATSSYKTPLSPSGADWEAEIDISQSWEKLCVFMKAQKSRSESVSAALISKGNGEFQLIYHFKNDPTEFEDGLNAHHGFVDMVIAKDLRSAHGVYFTGRGRSSYGTMTWERSL